MRRTAVTGRRRARASRCKEAAPGAGREASIGVVRRTPPAALLSALVVLLLVPAAPPAARGVLVMDAHGRVRAHRDAAAATTAEARPSAAAAHALRAQPATRARAQTTRGSVLAVLGALGARGEVTPEERTTWAAGWRSASATLKKLRGARRAQLGAVAANLTALARAGRLTPSRAPQAFLTLERNRAWWTSGPLLAATASASASAAAELVWQFYPGQGLQIQWLGHVRQAQRAVARGQGNDRASRAAGRGPVARPPQRAGGLALEYLFHFDGGPPPWVSALAQGTGLQALSRAAVAAAPPRPLPRHRASGARHLHARRRRRACACAPTAGAHYLQYSCPPQPARSSTASSSRSSACTTSRLAGNAARARCSTARRGRAARVEVPALRHRRVVAVLARPGRRGVRPAATTCCCATSCSTCASARATARVLRQPAANFTALPISVRAGRCGSPRR